MQLSNIMHEEMDFNRQYNVLIEPTGSTNKILVVKPIYASPQIELTDSCNLGTERDKQKVCTPIQVQPM